MHPEQGEPALSDEQWLRLQQAYALTPERVRGALDAGRSLADLLPPRAAPRGATGADAVGRALERLGRVGVRLVGLGSPAYPERLAAIADPPVVLAVRGRPSALARPAVAIVGARAATRAARDRTRRLARALAARGLVIVSGLARGIDAEAHRGALEAGGRTVGVLACGIDRVYPPEHRALADAICERGAVVSEMPLGTAPRRELFPLRNRVISGLSLGVIVVEARRRSGSLITVRHALAQGREVFVVPGPVDGPFATGSNRLLREGARVVLDEGDVLEDLGLENLGLDACEREEAAVLQADGADEADEAGGSGGSEGSGGAAASPLARALLARLAEAPATRDELLRAMPVEPGALAGTLLELELAGRVVTERDGRVHRRPG